MILIMIVMMEITMFMEIVILFMVLNDNNGDNNEIVYNCYDGNDNIVPGDYDNNGDYTAFT